MGRLGEVHDLLGDGVHGDGARHGAGRAVLAAGGLVAALARVVLLLHQVVARAEGHQVRVVGGRRDGHGARAAHVRVAQLVREALQLVRAEVVVVPQHVVVRRPRRALYALMAAQVEVELGGMRDAEVHGGAGGDVARLAGLLLLVGAEQARVVTLLHHYERDARLVFRFQLSK